MSTAMSPNNHASSSALPISTSRSTNSSSSKHQYQPSLSSSKRPGPSPLSGNAFLPSTSIGGGGISVGAGGGGGSPMSFSMGGMSLGGSGMSYVNQNSNWGKRGQGSISGQGQGQGQGMGMGFGSYAGKDVVMGSFSGMMGMSMGMGMSGMDPMTEEDSSIFPPYRTGGTPGNSSIPLPHASGSGSGSGSYNFSGANGSYRNSNMGMGYGGGINRGDMGSLGGGRMDGTSYGKSFVYPAGSWGREKGRMMKKEAEFCKDFMCCGKDLGNLHDLLEHYEEAHVVVVSSPSNSHMELSMEIEDERPEDHEHPTASSGFDVDMDDVLSEIASEPTTSSRTSSTNTSPVPGHALPGLLMKQLALEDVIRAGATAGPEITTSTTSAAANATTTANLTAAGIPPAVAAAVVPSPKITSAVPVVAAPIKKEEGESAFEKVFVSSPPKGLLASGGPSPLSSSISPKSAHSSVVGSGSGSGTSPTSVSGFSTSDAATSGSGVASKNTLNLSRKTQAYPGGRFGTYGLQPSHISSAFAIKSAFGPTVRKTATTVEGEFGKHGVNPVMAVPPNLLFMSNNAGMAGSSTSGVAGVNGGGSGKVSAGGAGGGGGGGGDEEDDGENSENGDGGGDGDGNDGNRNNGNGSGEPQPSLFATHRPFRCPQPGCQKSYKQSNGLKYHMSKGQCNFEVRDAVEWGGMTQEEAEEKSRPFMCAAGEGCNKRYRQMNGLKYHYMNSGLHGEIGLILIAQGQHPHPASLPPPIHKPRPSSNTIVSSQRGMGAYHSSGSSNSSRDSAVRTGGWVRDAQRASGKPLGLPVSGNDVIPQERQGEGAVLFTAGDDMML